LAVFHKIKKAWKFPLTFKLLVLEVLILSAIIRFVLLFYPFKRILLFLKKKEPNQVSHLPKKASQIGYFVDRVCPHTPWKSACLVQAIVGKIMLQRRKIQSTVFLGVAKNKQDELKAHAWLKSDNTYLTGYREMNDYTTIAHF